MMKGHKVGPGKNFMRDHGVQIKVALARKLKQHGLTCSQCRSMIYHPYVPFTATDEQLTSPWSDVHRPWLSAFETAQRALETKGKDVLCKYCHLLSLDYRDLRSTQGRDLEKKQQFYSELMGDSPCMQCGRARGQTTTRGFHFNHRVCRWEGKEKEFSLSEFFVDWADQYQTTTTTSATNSTCLNMSFQDAAPLMRAEANKCEVVCVSCHDVITQDQRSAAKKTCYVWGDIQSWMDARIGPKAITITI